ncbi:MAG: M42 family metallopeptidase [Clostridiales bacterium]|nr:M42 family metallopeptidase [Clostridiales bacterium]
MKLCSVPGATGWEREVSALAASQFRRYTDDVWTDSFFNTCARMGTKGRLRALVVSHIDQVALMVTHIHDDGFLGFTRIGGVDPRILPAQEVLVHGTEPLFGVIGAKPPHVLTPDERKKTIPIEDMFIDIGFDAAQARSRVRVGDIVTFNSPIREMAGGEALCGAALDDRAGVAVMCEAMERLRDVQLYPEVVFVAGTREETGASGIEGLAYREGFDLAVVMDVTHAETPDTPPFRAYPIDRLCITVGPRPSRALSDRLQSVAREEGVPFTISVSGRWTGTDGDSLQTVRDGLPFCIIEFPLRYMHTTVELLRWDVLSEAGRLLAAFLRSIGEGWEEWLCC